MIGTDEQIDRVIGSFMTSEKGPTLIFIGGVHGNEPCGVQALKNVVDKLRDQQDLIKGNFYAVTGNLPALAKGQRYIDRDLNRIWTTEVVDKIRNEALDPESVDIETQEQIELYNCIAGILDTNPGPFYFVDLHTVSSQSCPFLLINDVMINRKLATQFPAPVILGMEESVEGTLLNRANRLGHASIGVETGPHMHPVSVEKHEAFILLMLIKTGCLSKNHSFDVNKLVQELKSDYSNKCYKLIYKYHISEGEKFQMREGYENFQRIEKGEVLASNEQGDIAAPVHGHIFMPLYQSQGEDGFFVVRRIPDWALSLSVVLRKINFEPFLLLLPGVSRDKQKKYLINVDPSIARYYTIDIFHLLGYKRGHQTDDQLHFSKREYPVEAIQSKVGPA